MSANIIPNVDTIVVPEGSKYRAWHGMEKSRPLPFTLRDLREDNLLPHVTKSPIYLGNGTGVDGFYALTATTKRGDSRCLNVVSDRYSVIQNEDVFRTMSEAFKGTGLEYVPSCIGTIGGLKKFFISVAVGDDNGGFVVNGDKFYGNINFITSHDGGAFHAHDSLTRIVCSNTLRASMEGAKNMSFKIRHKGDIQAKCSELSSYLKDVFTAREQFIDQMGELAEQKVGGDDIRNVVAGYFVKESTSKLDKGFSTRTLNMIDGISTLAVKGRGNSGRTMYDVLNGATEYWSSGDGVGKNSSVGKRAYSSEFGTGAANKNKFNDYLVTRQFDSGLQEETKRVLALSY